MSEFNDQKSGLTETFTNQSVAGKKLPKGDKKMIVCFVSAGIVTIFSVFSFFGDAYSNTGGTVIPNVFDLMFGTTKTYDNFFLQWKQYGGLTFLFVWQILASFLSIAGFLACDRIRKRKNNGLLGVAVCSALAVMAFVSMILSFCTLSITDIKQSETYDVRLGMGPIMYSLLQISVIILSLFGIVFHLVQSSNGKPLILRAFSNDENDCSLRAATKVSSASGLSESEKADLITKYKKMLDEGIITQEEFDNKKTKLLK